jgi:hypothetical protein
VQSVQSYGAFVRIGGGADTCAKCAPRKFLMG